MKAQLILNVSTQKHLISKALTEYIDFSKRVYIAYGSTNQYLLYHLGIEVDSLYIAGCFTNNALNVTKNRPSPIMLDNGKLLDIKDFEITKEDYFIKGANALWYENNKKYAAVAAADEKGGTYGNFYIKAACKGSKVIIPVTHEKLIPFYNPSTQNVEIAMGSKIAMLKFFYGEIFTEIEAFRTLFSLEAKIIAAGGILGNEGSIVVEVQGLEKNINQAVDFIKKYSFAIEEKGEFFF
ncbi:hypothetical protein JCM11957_15100 [Caminibacter profundus]